MLAHFQPEGCLFVLGFYAVFTVIQLVNSDGSQIHISWTIFSQSIILILAGMDKCNGRHDITEILLKTALNTVTFIINQTNPMHKYMHLRPHTHQRNIVTTLSHSLQAGSTKSTGINLGQYLQSRKSRRLTWSKVFAVLFCFSFFFESVPLHDKPKTCPSCKHLQIDEWMQYYFKCLYIV